MKKKKSNNKSGLKEFLRIGWNKIVIFFILLIVIFSFLIFEVFFGYSEDITFPVIILFILTIPAVLLYLASRKIDIFVLLIVQILYVYFLACILIWLRDKIKGLSRLRKKIAIVGILLLVVIILLGIFSPNLKKFIIKTPIPEDLNDVVITLHRSVCFGTCPEYSLTIYGNGTIIYMGKEYVNVTGERVYNISQEEVQLLVNEFIEINYFALEDRYSSLITDAPSTTTSIIINGKRKSIYRYIGGPKELKDLENKIDKVVDSKQFIVGEQIESE